ncbi:MAG TPA: hypothetical protein VHB21_04265 [Minicystis sp.]|nr:hypothetical protein [Minicystis sp.]
MADPRLIVADRADRDAVVVVFESGDVHRSDDGGKSFAVSPFPSFAGPFGALADSVAAEPGVTTTLALGTQNNVYTTHDGGASWTQAAAFTDEGAYVSVAPGGDVVWVKNWGSAARFFRSTDGGVSFHDLGAGMDGVAPDLVPDPVDPAILWFLQPDGLSRLDAVTRETATQHRDVRAVATVDTAPPAKVFSVDGSVFAFSPANPEVVYVGAAISW